MTRTTEGTTGLRPLAGLVLMILGISIGLVATLLAQSHGAGWVVPAYLWLSLIALGFYVVAVYLPAERTRRKLREVEAELAEEERRIATVLGDLERGDFVRALEPSESLPNELAAVLHGAVEALAGLVRQILASSVQVAGQGSAVRETASELASGSTEQAAAVVEITATMEELARTAAQIASNAAGQAERADAARTSSEEGTAAVEAAVVGVESVREKIQEIASHTESIDVQSGEIYRILDLISEIAHETHILALNAAIEASSAGEHGKRFSVVADEVGRLAQRSRESVESVRSILKNFRSAIRATVVATEEGTKEAERAARDARAAASVIEGLREAIEETARAAREISAATREQQSASDQVVQTIREVGDVIQREAEGLRRFTRAAEELNAVALEIQLLAQAFRVRSSRSLKNRILEWAEAVGNPATQLQATKSALDAIVEENGFIELAYVVDPDGILTAWAVSETVPEDRLEAIEIGRSYADRPWFQAIRRGETCLVTPLYESLLTGQRCFTVAAVIPGPHGAVAGAIGIDIDAKGWTRI